MDITPHEVIRNKSYEQFSEVMLNVNHHTSYSTQYTYKSIVFFSYLFIIGKPKKVQDSTNTANNEEQKDIDNSNEKENGGGKTNQSTGKRRFKFGG